MLRHHNSWYAFVTNRQKLGLQCISEDIILVRGTMKTSCWTIGAFPGQTNRSHDISAGAEIVSVGKAKLRVATTNLENQNCVQRSGPRPDRAQSTPSQSFSRRNAIEEGAMDIDSNNQALKEDIEPIRNQCIFLSYYKIRYRKFFLKKIEARADPMSLDKDDDDSDSSAIPAMPVDAVIESQPEQIRVSHCPLLINIWKLILFF